MLKDENKIITTAYFYGKLLTGIKDIIKKSKCMGVHFEILVSVNTNFLK